MHYALARISTSKKHLIGKLKKNYLLKENCYLVRKSKTFSKSQFSEKFLDLIKNNNTIVNISGYRTLKLIYLLE